MEWESCTHSEMCTLPGNVRISATWYTGHVHVYVVSYETRESHVDGVHTEIPIESDSQTFLRTSTVREEIEKWVAQILEAKCIGSTAKTLFATQMERNIREALEAVQ